MASKTSFATLAGSAMPSLDGQPTAATPTTTTPTRRVGGIAWNQSLASNTPTPAPAIVTKPLTNGTAPNLHQLQHLSQHLDGGGAASSSKAAGADEPFVSVADLLERKKIEIIQNIVDQQMEKVRLELEKAAEERLAQTWEEEKKRVLQELAGDRVLGGSSRTVPKSSMTTHQTTHGAVSSATVEDLSHLAQSHVQIVARTTGTRPTPSMAEDLARTETAAPAYRMALQLVYTLQQQQQRTGSTSLAATTTLQRAHGSLKHLALQYQRHMTHVVQQASLAGQDVSLPAPLSHSMANTILCYTKLQHGSSSATIWHHLYYALRCGDAFAGVELLRTSTSINGAIVARIQQLAQHQGPSNTCLWENNDMSLPEATNKADLTDLMARRQNAATPYEVAVLTLLLLDKKDDSSSLTSVLQTIEDYVYVRLYRADDDEQALEGLGASIRDFGPAHFEPNNTHQNDGGWSFAFPLLLTQQYRSALAHLAQTGGPRGLLEATHLAILLGEEMSKLDVGVSPVDASHSVLTSLLVEFAKQLQPVDPEAAIVYLVRIPTDARRQTELAKLVVETRQYEHLAGVVGVNGQRLVPPERHPPALVKYLEGNETQVSRTLEEAGRLAPNIRESCELLHLAERYDLLLQCINEELARQLMEPMASEERKYWMDAARVFYEAHLGSTATKDYVTTVLEQRHATARVTTMDTLLKLMEAVDKLTKQDFKGATAMLDDLGWIPSAPGDVPDKAALYQHRLAGDPVLQSVYGPVLAQATKSLFAQWNLVKHSGMMMDTSTPVPLRLKGLQMQAQAILNLAGRVSSSCNSVDDETISKMTNMVAHMAST